MTLRHCSEIAPGASSAFIVNIYWYGYMQEYLAQWVAKVAAAEKEYRAALEQMERPHGSQTNQPLSAAVRSGKPYPLQMHFFRCTSDRSIVHTIFIYLPVLMMHVPASL